MTTWPRRKIRINIYLSPDAHRLLLLLAKQDDGARLRLSATIEIAIRELAKKEGIE